MKSTLKDIKDPGRRDFFTKIVLASLATSMPPLVMGCNDSSKFRGSGMAPYKVWEEMLYHLRTSPDHLEGRMESLIKVGDPEAMFNFVRDEIYLIPRNVNYIGYGDAYKWGLDYVLRSGMATAREKAELLNSMYKTAGISSKVVQERTAISAEEAHEFFFRPIERSFQPEISKAILRRWAKEMSPEGLDNSSMALLEDEIEIAQALGEKIWQNLELPEDFNYPKTRFAWDNYRTPTVEFVWEQETRYAHLFDPKISFGKLRSGKTSNVRTAKEIRKNKEKVTVVLSYRDSITPGEEKELISGQWLAADLVGRQLDILFLNNLSLEQMAVTPVGNIRTFTPAFSLQAIGQSTEYMAERSILADPITLSGKRIKVAAAIETPQIGDSILLPKPDPELQKQVRSLEVSASTTGYPGVKLSISPKDNTGNIIEGLSASDFQISEGDIPISALMEGNQQTPRVLLLSDGSGSMPLAYRGKGMKMFSDQLKEGILQKYPAAIITHWVTPSSLFKWLLKASQTENDLIIFATDGHNDDTYNPKNELVYRDGPPAIILDVYNSKRPSTIQTFEKMAALTGGLHLTAANQEEARKGISDYLEGIEIQPYTFTYNSIGSGSNVERQVEVNVDNKRVSGTAIYQFGIGEVAEEIGPSLIGLYLEVKYSSQNRVKRVLAGWDSVVNPSSKPSRMMADEVHDLMLGGMQLYFEGAGPTYAAALSDLLKAKLSTRKWGEAVLKDNTADAKEAFKMGQINISGSALTFMAPISAPVTKATLTVPGGLRIGLQTIKPGFITNKTKIIFDYLPTSEYNTFCTDPKKGFKTTLLKTAQLAVRENQVYQTSTLSELHDKNWINIKNAHEQKWFTDHRDNNDRYWSARVRRSARLRLFDSSASSRAFWQIDHKTGELYGILPDMSGGSQNEIDNQIERFDNLMTALTSLMAIMEQLKILRLSGIGSFSLGVVAMYGQLLVKLYAIASEAIMIMDASFVNEQIQQALAQFACDVAKEVVYATTGGVGKIMGGLDTLIGLIAPESNPFPCN